VSANESASPASRVGHAGDVDGGVGLRQPDRGLQADRLNRGQERRGNLQVAVEVDLRLQAGARPGSFERVDQIGDLLQRRHARKRRRIERERRGRAGECVVGDRE